MFDAYTKETIDIMLKLDNRGYFDALMNSELPSKNKITLLYLKVKDCEKEANEKILSEAMKRKEVLNG